MRDPLKIYDAGIRVSLIKLCGLLRHPFILSTFLWHTNYAFYLIILTEAIVNPCRTHVLEYSLVIASVISIGHLSTTALAASTLGSMTASVTGYSIIQGFTSTLDTMLPSAWTSQHPQLVGLWAQRMGM